MNFNYKFVIWFLNAFYSGNVKYCDFYALFRKRLGKMFSYQPIWPKLCRCAKKDKIKSLVNFRWRISEVLYNFKINFGQRSRLMDLANSSFALKHKVAFKQFVGRIVALSIYIYLTLFLANTCKPWIFKPAGTSFWRQFWRMFPEPWLTLFAQFLALLQLKTSIFEECLQNTRKVSILKGSGFKRVIIRFKRGKYGTGKTQFTIAHSM